MGEPEIQIVDMTRVVVMECTEKATGRRVWAWCVVNDTGIGFDEITITTPNGLTVLGIDLDNLKFLSTLFVL